MSRTFCSPIQLSSCPLCFIMLMFSLVMGSWRKRAAMGRHRAGNRRPRARPTPRSYMEKQTGVTLPMWPSSGRGQGIPDGDHRLLHNPKKYTDIGDQAPQGCFAGRPLRAPAKTLLAKAVGRRRPMCPSLSSSSGSELLWRCSWAGARPVVRDLFKEAAKVAPCIVFIDEIDTIGKSRDSGASAA